MADLHLPVVVWVAEENPRFINQIKVMGFVPHNPRYLLPLLQPRKYRAKQLKQQ